jgi:hypothetical protein
MKKRFLIGLTAMLVAGFILIACESSPPPRQLTPNERLLDAAANGNFTGVRSALDNGANINVQNSNGATALIYAAGRSGNLEMVRYLVERGADLNLRNNSGMTALHIAFDWNRTVIARYLIDSGINVNARNNAGKTALNMAYEKGEMELYNYLIAHGAREFEPNQVAQQPAAPAPQTNVYVQPSAPAQSSTPAPAPSVPTFQTGTYAWSNSGQNMTMNFGAGIVRTELNYRQIWFGTYRINGTQLVISVTSAISDYSRLNGMTYSYTITSSTSFSGSGETWVRTGF